MYIVDGLTDTVCMYSQLQRTTKINKRERQVVYITT